MADRVFMEMEDIRLPETVAWRDQLSRPAMVQDRQECPQANTLDDAADDSIMFMPTPRLRRSSPDQPFPTVQIALEAGCQVDAPRRHRVSRLDPSRVASLPSDRRHDLPPARPRPCAPYPAEFAEPART